MKTTLDGIEAFWDLGCCLLYLCLKILIFLNVKKSPKRGKVGMKITLQPPRRPLWRLVTNDGYLLSISASVASRGCLLIMPVKYMAWVLPILLILDLKTQLVKDFTCCIKKKDEHSIYVTSASKTTSMGSSQTSNTEAIPRYVLGKYF